MASSQHPAHFKRQIPPEGGALGERAKGPDYLIDENGCWVWQRGLTRGYPRLGIRGLDQRAHRAYFEIAKGPIPEGYDIHHTCKNQLCVNPDHLEGITQREHDIEHFLGEKAGLTIGQVLEIRERGRIYGVRAEDVAEEFGIYWSTVNNYWAGDRRWSEFFGDDPGPAVPIHPPCPECGGHVERGPSGGPSGKRSDRRKEYCSPACRQKAYWRRRRVREGAGA